MTTAPPATAPTHPMLGQRILVPVDFSPCSRAALDYALSLAPALGASIEAIHAFEAPFYEGSEHTVAPGHPGQTVPEVLREERRIELEAFVDAVAGDRFVTRTFAIGAPATVILEAAERCAMVVMGRHGHTALQHLLFGSVTETVFKQVRCPILIVRRDGAT